MKRILHVVSSLADDSGVMHVVMNYYRYIEKKKINFDFLYFKEFDHSFKNEIISYDGRCFLLPRPSLSSRRIYKDFFKENAKNYDAIHLHPTFLNMFILPLAKKYGIKNRIVHSHTTMYSDKFFSSIRNFFFNLPLRHNANWYFGCSIAAGDFLYGKKRFLKDGKSFLINNAINVDRFVFDVEQREKIRNEYNIKDSILIGHVGRFTEGKNHLFLIEIFNEFVKLKPNAKLMLIGNGNLRDRIKEKIKYYNLEDSVIFTGQVKNVNDYLNALDIFVMPSLYEGLPIVGVEAQTNGLPIVLSDSITREVGLVNYRYASLDNSAENWAKEILDLYLEASSFDRINALEIITAKGFNIKNEAQKLETIYSEIMEGIK
jgi:glycosyltransferase involved in cell wall biosynthesis